MESLLLFFPLSFCLTFCVGWLCFDWVENVSLWNDQFQASWFWHCVWLAFLIVVQIFNLTSALKWWVQGKFENHRSCAVFTSLSNTSCGFCCFNFNFNIVVLYKLLSHVTGLLILFMDTYNHSKCGGKLSTCLSISTEIWNCWLCIFVFWDFANREGTREEKKSKSFIIRRGSCKLGSELSYPAVAWTCQKLVRCACSSACTDVVICFLCFLQLWMALN